MKIPGSIPGSVTSDITQSSIDGAHSSDNSEEKEESCAGSMIRKSCDIAPKRQTIGANTHFRKHLIYLKILLGADRSLILSKGRTKGEQVV